MTDLNRRSVRIDGLREPRVGDDACVRKFAADGVVKVLHHPPKARRVVQLFMGGAASHIDLWDHKPMLEKHHGEASDFGEHVEAFQNGLGPWMKSPFKFSPHGETGKMISEVVEPLGALRRRHRLCPQHGRQDRRAFAGDLPAGDRFSTSRFSRHGLVDQLRSRSDQRKPADVRRAARSSWLRQQRTQELGLGVLAGQFSQGTAIFPQRDNPIEDLQPQADFVTAAGDREVWNCLAD